VKKYFCQYFNIHSDLKAENTARTLFQIVCAIQRQFLFIENCVHCTPITSDFCVKYSTYLFSVFKSESTIRIVRGRCVLCRSNTDS